MVGLFTVFTVPLYYSPHGRLGDDCLAHYRYAQRDSLDAGL